MGEKKKLNLKKKKKKKTRSNNKINKYFIFIINFWLKVNS